MSKELIRLITLILIFLSAGHAMNAQSFSDYKSLLNPQQNQSVLSLEEDGFEIVSIDEIDGCIVHTFKKQESTFIHNLCDDQDGIWINFVLIEKDLATIVNLLNEAYADTIFYVENATVASSSAIVFIEEELKELYFMLDHQLGLYTLSGANTAQLELMKEEIESDSNFDPQQDFVSLLRSIMEAENHNDETVQTFLDDFMLSVDLDLLDIPSARAFISDFEDSMTQDTFEQIIESKFLSDETYIMNVHESLLQMEMAMANGARYVENIEEILLKIAIENKQFESFLMLSFICDQVREKISQRSTNPECDLGWYSGKALSQLRPEQVNNIIEDDTLYLRNDILLTNSVFSCPSSINREMKVLRNLKETTALLIQSSSDYRNDSLLFINTHFFISPLERGLIVSNHEERGSSRFDYPEDETLYALTIGLQKEGLYKLEDGEFILMTDSMSQDAFKEYCTNETCYIPYPGILYESKINLNQLKSLDGLLR